MTPREDRKDIFVVIPGYVVSSNDNQRHYISAFELMKLYRVHHQLCVVYEPTMQWNESTYRMMNERCKNLIALTPNPLGNYSINPSKIFGDKLIYKEMIINERPEKVLNNDKWTVIVDENDSSKMSIISDSGKVIVNTDGKIDSEHLYEICSNRTDAEYLFTMTGLLAKERAKVQELEDRLADSKLNVLLELLAVEQCRMHATDSRYLASYPNWITDIGVLKNLIFRYKNKIGMNK